MLIMQRKVGEGTNPFLNKFDLESYTNVYWIDGTGGSDANPGTEALPRQNYNSTMGIMGSGDLMIVKPGNYTGNYIPADAFTSAGFGAKAGTSVTAEFPGLTKFTNSNTGVRDEPVLRNGSFANPPKIYGLVFEHNFVPAPTFDFHQNEVAIFKWASYDVYNCAFPLHSSNSSSSRSMNYNNSNDHQPKCFNCTFADAANWMTNFSGLDVDTLDCAFKFDMPTSNELDDVGSILVPNGNYTNDTDFANTVDNSKGVYGGTFAWEKLPSTY